MATKNNDYKDLLRDKNFTDEQLEITLNLIRNLSDKVLDKYYGEDPL